MAHDYEMSGKYSKFYPIDFIWRIMNVDLSFFTFVMKINLIAIIFKLTMVCLRRLIVH